jgi:glycosyltransferase involved in cell wall biosynthesis
MANNICNVSPQDQYWGDRFIGITLDKAGIKPFYDKRFVDITTDPLSGVPKQYNDIISYHGKSTVPRILVLPKDLENIHSHFQESLRPIRVAMVVDQWSKGGAEKEFADMILDADPNKIKYVGIAMNIAWEFYLRNDLKGKMPPFHTHEKRGYNTAIDKDYLNLHETFEQAIQEATKEADVIIKWHTYNLFLENINKPSILLSNATAWYTEAKYKKVYADKYVGNSRWSTEWLPKQATDKLVIYSGHSEDRVQPINGRDYFRDNIGFNEKDKVVSHIGRINLDKNIKPLCQAVASLSKEWKLLLVGRIPIFHKEELEEILEEYLPNRHKLVSWIDNVGDAFAASDVFVLSSFYEGFSNALAEAWMSKTPTVFSRCGSADELIEKYGNIGIDIATDASVELLAESIAKAPSNIEGTENAYNMIKTFTKEKAARNWERCITGACYDRKTLKVGLLGKMEDWTKILLNNTSRGQIEYTILDENFDASNLDAIITWGTSLKPLNLKIPIILYSSQEDNAEILRRNCYQGSSFVSNSEFKNLFPDEVKKSVSIINNDFGETNFVNRWVNFIQKSAEKYENFHTHQPNLFSLIPELLSKYKTKKRVARKLNIMNIPPPEGEKGWNYILIEKYLG